MTDVLIVVPSDIMTPIDNALRPSGAVIPAE
jgi:hypothetical protein